MVDDGAQLRLAVISTPRSGNTWLRALVTRLYGLEQVAVHKAEQIDWASLPARSVIQIHWYPVEPFPTDLARHGVRVIVLARHPLDVLMSWLNYATYVHLEGYCPGRDECDKCDIVGVTPRSEALLAYCRGHIGRWLLGHSPAWWVRPGVIRVRYEDLVAEPLGALGRLVEQIGEPVRLPLGDVVQGTSIGRLKPGHEVWHYHYWQGQPGLWRSMLPAGEARAIASAVPEPFEVLGYTCDPDESLDPTQADVHWLRLQLETTREHLTLERFKHRAKDRELSALRVRLDEVRRSIVEERRSHAEARVALSVLRGQWDALNVHPRRRDVSAPTR